MPARPMADPEEGPEDDFYQRFAAELEVLAELGGGHCWGAMSGTGSGGGGREPAGRTGLCSVQRPTRGSPPVTGAAVQRLLQMTRTHPLDPKSPNSGAESSRRRSPTPPGTPSGAATRGAPTPGRGTGAVSHPAPRHRPQPTVGLAQAGSAAPVGPRVLLTPLPPGPKRCGVLLEEQPGTGQ